MYGKKKMKKTTKKMTMKEKMAKLRKMKGKGKKKT
tara:strand:+ start:2380 stop:2484 length:105 start_codon:yes stop_codon:yes gene_type:complete